MLLLNQVSQTESQHCCGLTTVFQVQIVQLLNFSASAVSSNPLLFSLHIPREKGLHPMLQMLRSQFIHLQVDSKDSRPSSLK